MTAYLHSLNKKWKKKTSNWKYNYELNVKWFVLDGMNSQCFETGTFRHMTGVAGAIPGAGYILAATSLRNIVSTYRSNWNYCFSLHCAGFIGWAGTWSINVFPRGLEPGSRSYIDNFTSNQISGTYLCFFYFAVFRPALLYDAAWIRIFAWLKQ